ncbi:MAG TPA: thioredoxin domain-containing protein [Terriglobia bacterium]|nr:thioredoxin domain-containing protein [Terriglobia bacterium]
MNEAASVVNGLSAAASPYLRSAAHQPVAWQEWGDAAFERARREDKPILLDIGAVWCHWCHVLDRESYEDGEIAGIINQHYVAVKVDRDERPDIDARYQMAISALTGQGGWPLTAILTPDGKPFFGGTYFPPDDRYGRPGMKRILETIAHNYRTHRGEIHTSAEQIAEALGKVEIYKPAGQAGPPVVETIVASIKELYDPEHGGFGRAPKFPHPVAVELLLDQYLERGERRLLDIVTHTLEAMGRRGVYDQIGDGFHRYSVDEHWGVPHFEKMSYDNSGLLVNYLHAWQLTRQEVFREVALGILTFVEKVLARPGGGFYASQDADVNLEDDGDYFTWTLDELRAALDEQEARVAALRFGIGSTGEMHHNPAKNVLFIDQPLEAITARTGLRAGEVLRILERVKAKMLAARLQRPTPFTDPTMYAGWNAMMASALLEAYKVLGLEGARDRALQTLDLFMENAWDARLGVAHLLSERPPQGDDGTRAWRPSFVETSSSTPPERLAASNFDLLDDQVLVASALLDAFEVTGESRYFDRALALGELVVQRFWDSTAGGFFDMAIDAGDRRGALAVRRKALQDSPTPAGNSVAIAVLDRLALLTGRRDLGEKADRTLDLFATKAGEYGLFASTYGLALARHLRGSVEIIVVGLAADSRREELWRAAQDAPVPGKRVLALTPEAIAGGSLPSGLAATLPHLKPGHNSFGLVCTGNSCQPPATTAEDLRDALRRSGTAQRSDPPRHN